MDTAFFLASKLAWFIVSPSSVMLVGLALILLLLRTGNLRLARRAAAFLLLALLPVAFFPVGEWLLFPLESRFPANPVLPERVDGIIMLGGAERAGHSSVWRQPEFTAHAERPMAFIALARRYPQAKLIFSGGSGRLVDRDYREGEVARMLFAQIGPDPAGVTFEIASRNTVENALYSKRLVSPRPGENWVLITSAAHMPRAIGVFCALGWPVIPYPVDHQSWPGHLLRLDLNLGANLAELDSAVHEWAGLVSYAVTRKTPAVLPRPCNAAASATQP
ncbi:Uncharacterized SAM-binding protein YcdF, DUF218 family [Noviherbaspirillum humi]|uniref:Uncharacterized SAM-binding protein YcdF, DUF218 family n=1 Tax=Noviherbaspirillum humi TaxID=1688639 RepID=A0A239DQL6_9BURK|nr:YdcF family protein [Noviherbaspirillum humi]SNS34637.1 Uncharacterized SAM-binding protein YcdF, DUF218 family [Noviherbaspirillum humi]